MTPPAPQTPSGPTADYLAQVARHLRDLDAKLRAGLIAIAAENLAERPDATAFRDLVADLGGPGDYARLLRDEAESAEPGTVTHSRSKRRRRRRWSIGLVAALVIASSITLAWWVTWQADIQSTSLRVCADAAAPADEECSRAGMRDVDLADIVEVTCRDTISISQNLTADREITVTGASLTGIEPRTGSEVPTEPGSAPPMVIDEVQVWQNTDPAWDPKRLGWPVTIGPYPVDTFVTFMVTTCPPTATPGPGMSRFIESMEVTYRALGRDRSMTIPLIETVSVTTR